MVPVRTPGAAVDARELAELAAAAVFFFAGEQAAKTVALRAAVAPKNVRRVSRLIGAV